MLHEGDRAPDFLLPSDDGSEIALSAFSGKHVVLYFFVKALTSG
jgi:peroxiredoxin Q/BCP